MTAPDARFVFVCCQVGAEAACKQEFASRYPKLKFAFSRPGFLTFKWTAEPPTGWQPVSTFARTWGWSVGRVQGSEGADLAAQVVELARPLAPTLLHGWQRDLAVPGDRGFEPGSTPLAETACQAVAARWKEVGLDPLPFNRRARSRERVLDLILVEPDQWWVGWHTADSVAQTWPGGVPDPDESGPIISRAWLKAAEAAVWGQVPLRAGEVCIEIGSAPGGSTQYLLQRGLKVIAIDPAEMDEAIAGHPRLRHLRRRARDVPNRELAGAAWLFTDINMPPDYTLDVVADYVQERRLPLRGFVSMLKLADWSLAAEVDAIRARARGLGFQVIRTRQLAFNRQEYCLIALRHQFQRRLAGGAVAATHEGAGEESAVPDETGAGPAGFPNETGPAAPDPAS